MAGSSNIESVEELMQALQKLPGIGPRSAERITFHLLRADRAAADQLARAIQNIKNKIFHCKTCFNLTEQDPCAICSDPRRDQSQIWVVEQPKDVMALEQTGLPRGVYHVLLGHIAPLEGVEPTDLTIDHLIKRTKEGNVAEVILATNPTVEGDGTALYIESVLSDTGVRISRLARGLAVGSQLDYASQSMLEAAIRGRGPIVS